jgi:hypothetical protein
MIPFPSATSYFESIGQHESGMISITTGGADQLIISEQNSHLKL